MSKLHFLKQFGDSVYRRTPEIMLATGIIGMITTVVLAVKATPKALTLVEEAKKEQETDELAPVEVVKATWKCYIPATITGIGAIICLILGHSTEARRHAALAAAYSISENALREYQEKVKEAVGEKKEQAIKDAVDKDRIEAHRIDKADIIVTGKGNTLCYDHWTGRYFYSDVEHLKRAALEVSRLMLDTMYVSLNDYYSEIGLQECPIGDILGWNANRDGLIELRPGAQLYDEDTPCYVLDYVNPPTISYMH